MGHGGKRPGGGRDPPPGGSIPAAQSQAKSILPDVLEPSRRQLGVTHGQLNAAMSQVRLERPRICPLVRQGKACRME
jgi:hypothetical protein